MDFFLFSRVKNTWKGKGLDDVLITEHSEMEQLLPIPKTDFREIFPVSSGTVNKVVHVEEAYMLVNRLSDFRRLTLDVF